VTVGVKPTGSLHSRPSAARAASKRVFEPG
jgi:hypothetical protein